MDIECEIVIDRPCEEVASFAADPDNAPRWYRNIKSVEWKTSPPLQVGSRVAFLAHFLGRKLGYTYEIAEWVPAERLIMCTTGERTFMETTYIWTPTHDGKTSMRLRNRGEVALPSKLYGIVFGLYFGRLIRQPLDFFFSVMAGRANRKDLAALKLLLERR